MTKNTHKYEYARLTEHTPLLAYDSTEPYEEWRQAVKEKLTELLGLLLASCDPCLTVETRERVEDRIEISFTVQTEPGYIVPCWLWYRFAFLGSFTGTTGKQGRHQQCCGQKEDNPFFHGYIPFLV